jgi:transcriptional regulator of acetoin/glycerol metabolism
MGRARVKLTAAAIDTLLRHEWPGNVRELFNALERATIVCDDGLIRAEDLSLAPPMVPVMVDSTDLHVVERQAIERAMREVNGNKSRAARQLGISRTQLYFRLRKHGLERDDMTLDSVGGDQCRDDFSSKRPIAHWLFEQRERRFSEQRKTGKLS